MRFSVGSTVLGVAVGLYALPFTLFAAEKALMKGHVAAARPVSFEVYIPIQKRAQLEKDLNAMQDPGSPAYHKWLKPAQVQTRYGATEKQIAGIKSELEAKGLTATVVTGNHIRVTGPAAAVEKALNTRLQSGVYTNGKSIVAAAKAITPPDSLTRVGAKVVGLTNKMPMVTHARRKALPSNRYSEEGPYWFTDLKQAYGFPSYKVLTGKGVTIATLGSGAYVPDDMALYFGHEKLKVPKISEINVDGGSDVSDDSFETNLDIQQAAGMAPGAKVVHYNLPDLSDNSIIDGLAQIITDDTADIVTMSFGLPELFYTPAYNQGVDYRFLVEIQDDLMAQGNAQGITFIASSGDTGALTVPPLVCFDGGDNCGTMRASASFPATSPHVTAVGGTNLVTVNDGTTRDSTYVRENAFGDPAPDFNYGTSAVGGYWGSGGGDSIYFKKPKAQTLFDTGNAKFRTIPDVSLHMGGCPFAAYSCGVEDSADLEYFMGSLYGVIGTSASAPDFAGLTALGEERNGARLGNVNYQMYTVAYMQSTGSPIKAFKKKIPGFNGKYFTSSKFYNRVIGLGTLNGTDSLFIPKAPKAGIPQTPSNP